MATIQSPFGAGLPLSGGTITGNLTVTGSINQGTGPTPIMVLQQATAVGGFALQNATPGILSYTTPNDGNNHRVALYASQEVTVAETGGLVQFRTVDPAAGVSNTQVFPGGGGTGSSKNNQGAVVGPNTLVQVNQNSALTVGTATVWAELWGS